MPHLAPFASIARRPALLICIVLLGPAVGRPAVAADLASWKAAETIEATGLRSLSGADGVTEFVRRGGSRCITPRADTRPVSRYLYFLVDAQRPSGEQSCYLVVEYFDSMGSGTLQVQYDSSVGEGTDSHYCRSEDQAGGYQFGIEGWHTAVFRLDHPRFAHRQNLGADLRLGGGHPVIRSLRLTADKPPEWDAANQALANIGPKVRIGDGGELIVGGFDPVRADGLAARINGLKAVLPAFRLFGVTSHEGYVRWNLCEPTPGRYDWGIYDRYVDLYRRNGLKWVPFLIVGPAYSLPDWFYKSSESQGYVCLEHGQETQIQSLWNPRLRAHAAQFIKAFCDHYRDTGMIESILLGVTGNFGEAIYPATDGFGWTAEIHGKYHSHTGFWAGDRYAVESFRQFVHKKYQSNGRLHEAWGPKARDITVIRPFLRDDAPNDRAWLDFTDWYIGSMTEWSRFWMQETRKNFRGEIYLCTGGHAPAAHGADFAEQCRIAAEAHGGVRITNEGSDYRHNFALTRWVASASRQYGAYFSFEPASSVTPDGVVARIYNATASGARGLHFYNNNLFGNERGGANFLAQGSQFRQRRPRVEIAVYYPETFIRLEGHTFLNYVQPLRDDFDFDYLSDRQIADGGLSGHKALILLQGNVAEAATWRSIRDWVKQGGWVLRPGDLGKLHCVEGDGWPEAVFSGQGPGEGSGRVLTSPSPAKSEQYREFVTRSLRTAENLAGTTRRMLSLDGQEDGVFVTAFEDELLWLNFTSQLVRKALPEGKGPLELPPLTIVSQKIP
jgi:hypothetical protein